MRQRFAFALALLIAFLFASVPAAASEQPSALTPPLHADTQPRPTPAIVGYGGFGARFDMASVGGFWWGFTGSVGVRWMGRLDFRVDGVVSLLVPSSKRAHECGEPPCGAGLRAVLSPSIGHRFPLGTVSEGERALALTPSIGLALGAQVAARDLGASAFDAKTPSTWMLLEPGLALSIGPLEIRTHLRIPRGSIRDPMFDIGFGVARRF